MITKVFIATLIAGTGAVIAPEFIDNFAPQVSVATFDANLRAIELNARALQDLGSTAEQALKISVSEMPSEKTDDYVVTGTTVSIANDWACRTLTLRLNDEGSIKDC